uniref:(northern house mosquito) hypothetical protein n=1 Tax=Culex pipiens TaxID=7175 RepID=A0A8D8EW86_CULPI
MSNFQAISTFMKYPLFHLLNFQKSTKSPLPTFQVWESFSHPDCTQTEQTLTCWRGRYRSIIFSPLTQAMHVAGHVFQLPPREKKGGKSFKNPKHKNSHKHLNYLLWTVWRLTRDPAWYSGKHSSGPRKSGKSTAGKRGKLLFLSLGIQVFVRNF